MQDRGYPVPRPRAAAATLPHADVFERTETTRAFVTTGDNEATLHEFSGVVDRVKIDSRTADIFVKFMFRGGDEADEHLVTAAIAAEFDVRCDMVRGRSALAATPSLVAITGFFARRSGHLPVDAPPQEQPAAAP